MRKFLVSAAVAALVPVAATAATYDVVADYNSSVFAYGTGEGASSFTPYAVNAPGGCFSVGNFPCHANDVNVVPSIGVNATGANIHFQTVDVPNDTLFLHPAEGAGATDAVLQFIAPTAGSYSFAGAFSRLDNQTSNSIVGGNNGVLLSIFKTVDGISSLVTSSDALSGLGVSQGASYAFSSSADLDAGDILSFVVANNGQYYNDSTGLTATITAGAVPEPASWAMMVGGFGMVGAAMRRRQGALRTA